MRFGWMTLSLSPSPGDDLACVHQQLEQGVLAEAMGFDHLWLTEHNFTGECAYADPIPFAGALAMRTSRARIGFAVIQMALHHPVRLAIQLAALDNLSRGRLDVGIGRGSAYNEYEYVGFGLRSDDSRERMEEAITLLTRAWTEEPCVHEGKFFSVRLPAIRPRPVQRPHPPLWRSVIAPDSLVACGRAGIPVMMARVPDARIAERLARYREGLEAGGHDAPTRRRLLRKASVWRFLYVAESQAQAEDDVHAATLAYRAHMHHVREAYNPADFRPDPSAFNPWTDPALPHPEGVRFVLETGALYGTPGRVAEQIAALGDTGLGHVMCQTSWGGLPHAKVVASLRRFGEHVAPAFRDPED
jgi:alkanesulfonate monooxygenase SsuD/methylene tetrahydromethanopterin reductase-like flavin-dependent oxidoreductase (luciferase family)